MAKPMGPCAAVCGSAVFIEFETATAAVSAGCTLEDTDCARAVPRRERRTVAANDILTRVFDIP